MKQRTADVFLVCTKRDAYLMLNSQEFLTGTLPTDDAYPTLTMAIDQARRTGGDLYILRVRLQNVLEIRVGKNPHKFTNGDIVFIETVTNIKSNSL